MSALQWARRIRCDWPDCKSEGDVTLTDEWPDVTYPAGWTSLRPGLNLMFVSGTTINDFCSIHSAKTLADLAAAFPMPERTARP